MKKAILVGSLMAALSAGIFLVHALAQQQPGPQQEAKEGGVPAMPMNPQMMMQRMMGMMEQAGVDPGMMRRCMVMMRTQVFLDSPSAIRGQAEPLGLSDEQVKRLLDIENEARKKAKTVLTEEQRKKMGEVPDKPMAMMEMCQEMSGKMMPMMQKMMGGQETPQGPETKPDK